MNQYNAQIKLMNEDVDFFASRGQMNSVELFITNIGSEVWYAYDKENPILVGYHYINDRGELKEGVRTKLPYNLAPGESVLLKCSLVLETRANDIIVQWDLVHENKSWFESYGSSTLSIPVNFREKISSENKIDENTAIICENISKRFKMYPKNSSKIKEFMSFGIKKGHIDFWALKNLSFEVKKGETYGIIGFNGSGKSTLLSILAQTKQPTQGQFKVNGRIAALLELGAGFHPELTGRQNVIYNSYLYGIPSYEIEGKMEDIKEFANIGVFFDKPVKSYSSGMYVRLAFALAIHVDPDVLIIDEALAVGDEVFQRKCYSKFEEFKALGKTIILVTHDLNAVRALCDRVAIIYDGNLIFEGNSNDVVNYYQKMSLTANLQISDQHTTEVNEIRYGNGKARIVEYKLINEQKKESTVFKTGEKIIINLKAEVSDAIDVPVVGIIIKTINGIEVFGTNTKILGCGVTSVVKGNMINSEISLPLYLNEGTYFLTLGITDQSNGETVTVDRMIDVTFIRVVSETKCIGLVNMNLGGEAKIDVK